MSSEKAKTGCCTHSANWNNFSYKEASTRSAEVTVASFLGGICLCIAYFTRSGPLMELPITFLTLVLSIGGFAIYLLVKSTTVHFYQEGDLFHFHKGRFEDLPQLVLQKLHQQGVRILQGRVGGMLGGKLLVWTPDPSTVLGYTKAVMGSIEVTSDWSGFRLIVHDVRKNDYAGQEVGTLTFPVLQTHVWFQIFIDRSTVARFVEKGLEADSSLVSMGCQKNLLEAQLKRMTAACKDALGIINDGLRVANLQRRQGKRLASTPARQIREALVGGLRRMRAESSLELIEECVPELED